VTVWGDALAPHGGAVWLSGLIRLMAPFGMNERLVRTSVFRLVRDGWLVSESRGRRSRYRLTPEGERRFAQAHHRIYEPRAAQWDGDWEIAVAPPDSTTASSRAQLREELGWEGFGMLAPSVYVRPLHGDSALPRIVSAAGLASSVKALRARDDPSLGGVSLAASVQSAWNIESIAGDYRRFLARFDRVIEAFRSRDVQMGDPAQCFIIRTLLIHAFRRVLLRDPQLPSTLLPVDWPGTAAFALCRNFYRLTHKRAEMHLNAMLSPDGDTLPSAAPDFYRRFGGLN
jgi:phenylacetic acid degradation operon negative regulatory protein